MVVGDLERSSVLGGSELCLHALLPRETQMQSMYDGRWMSCTQISVHSRSDHILCDLCDSQVRHSVHYIQLALLRKMWGLLPNLAADQTPCLIHLRTDVQPVLCAQKLDLITCIMQIQCPEARMRV